MDYFNRKLTTSDFNDEYSAAIDRAARQQPRHSFDPKLRIEIGSHGSQRQPQSSLLYDLPLELRSYIWDLVLRSPARIERWRPNYYGAVVMKVGVDILDAECFPYRLATSQVAVEERLVIHPIERGLCKQRASLLLSCIQM